MSNLDDHSPKQHAGYLDPTVPTASPAADVENKNPTRPTAPPATNVQNKSPGTRFKTASEIVRRWKSEDFMKSCSLVLTGLALLFSMLSFIVMAANKRGDRLDFNRFEEYSNYVNRVHRRKAFRQAHELWTRKRMFKQRTSALFDFFGDQIMAYFLISAASSAVSLTHRIRETKDEDGILIFLSLIVDHMVTDSLAVAFVDTSEASRISMAFLAFFALSLYQP